MGEILLDSDADVPSRGPAPFRHVDWLERDIATERRPDGTIRMKSLGEPPSVDHNEITDKGYINQRAGLTRRSTAVECLYADPVEDDVIIIPR